MSVAIGEWGVRPIVTLVSEFASWETQWHGGDAETFQGGMQNILKLQVEFKYKKPYGGSARYRVLIDRLSGTTWANAITDEVGFYPQASDNTWHASSKVYDIAMAPSPMFPRTDRLLRFRITTQIEGPGHLPTGSGPGSLGSWSDPESREFTATFTKPTIQIVEGYIVDLERMLHEELARFKKDAIG